MIKKLLCVFLMLGAEINGSVKFADRFVEIDNSCDHNPPVGFRFWQRSDKGKKQFVSNIRPIAAGFIGTCAWDSTQASPEFIDIYANGRTWTLRLTPKTIRQTIHVKVLTPVYTVIKKNNHPGDFCISMDELEKRRAQQSVAK